MTLRQLASRPLGEGWGEGWRAVTHPERTTLNVPKMLAGDLARVLAELERGI